MQFALADRITTMKPSPALSAIAFGHAGNVPDRPCDDPALWAALLAGVEHFAAAIESAISAPGFVPKETAASVILQVGSDYA